VSVAQLVEHRSVEPRVAGSNPVAHPTPPKQKLKGTKNYQKANGAESMAARRNWRSAEEILFPIADQRACRVFGWFPIESAH
jgi:hypothetical protein